MTTRRTAAALLAALALAAWAAAPGASALALGTGYFGSGHEAGQGHRV
jgi:carbohydrate-selective porin OprB